MIQAGVAFDELDDYASLEENVRPLAIAFSKSRDIDPRFNFLDVLSWLIEQAEVARVALSEVEDKEKRTEKARAFASVVEDRKQVYLADAAPDKGSTPALVLMVGSVVTVLLSTVVSESSKALWKQEVASFQRPSFLNMLPKL